MTDLEAEADPPADPVASPWQEHFGSRHAAQAERKRIRNAATKRRTRAAKKAALMTGVAGDLAGLDMPTPKPFDLEAGKAAIRQLGTWLKLGGKRQEQFNSRAREIARSYVLLLRMRHELTTDPEPSEFATRLTVELGIPFDRRKARQRLIQLVALEGVGGPWSADAGIRGDAERPTFEGVTVSDQP